LQSLKSFQSLIAVLDEVSTAIHGGAAAVNVELSGWATITEKL